MRSLSLDQLRAFVEVVEQGSFSAAARRLALTQPAVSLQIRELEERFGVRLIDRLGREARPTVAGRELLSHARLIAKEAEVAEAAMRRRATGWLGRVRLAAGPNIVGYVLPPLLKRLREERPNLEFAIRAGGTDELVALVLRNEVDLAIVTMPVRDRALKVMPLRADPWYAVMPETEPDPPDEVTPEFFASRVLILDGRSQMDRIFRQWLRDGGVEANAALEIGNPEALRNLVAAGLGVSVLAGEVAFSGGVPVGGILARPFRPALVRQSALVQRKDKPPDEALRIARDALLTLGNLEGG